MKISADGIVTGTLKYVDNFEWFNPNNPSEQSGNYFPFKLGEEYENKQITIEKNDGEAKTAEETEWIIRIPNNSTTIKVKDSDKEIVTLTFNGAILQKPTGENRVKVMGQSEQVSYGQKPVSDLMKEDVKISWNGTSGTVTGTFKYVQNWEQLPKDPRSGHFFAMTIDKGYLNKPFAFYIGDEQKSAVEQATEDEMFWVLNIDKNKKFKFMSGKDVIAELDFSSAKLEQATKILASKGTPLMSVPKADTEPLAFTDEEATDETENTQDKHYTKSEINRMSTADLQILAAEKGVENAFEMTGTDLKAILIKMLAN